MARLTPAELQCMSLFDGPDRSGAVAEMRRRSGARTFTQLVEFMRTSGLREAELDAIGDDLHRRASTFDKADLVALLKRRASPSV